MNVEHFHTYTTCIILKPYPVLNIWTWKTSILKKKKLSTVKNGDLREGLWHGTVKEFDQSGRSQANWGDRMDIFPGSNQISAPARTEPRSSEPLRLARIHATSRPAKRMTNSCTLYQPPVAIRIKRMTISQINTCKKLCRPITIEYEMTMYEMTK